MNSLFKLLLLTTLISASCSLHAMIGGVSVMTQALQSYLKEKNNQSSALAPSMPSDDTSSVPWWLGAGWWHRTYENTKVYMGWDNKQSKIDYPQQYSINLMWINRQLQKDQRYVYPSGGDDGKKFLNTIVAWAQKNPTSIIHIWFDSSTTTQEAVKNTQEAFNREAAKFGKDVAKLELRDIRDLTVVRNNQDVFSSDIPVYLRADLLRAVLAEEILQQDKHFYFVYADFDVKPLSKTELFDTKTLENLKKYHFVMAHENNTLGFENSFQIFTYDENLLKAANIMLIEANLMRARSFLKQLKGGEGSHSVFSNPKTLKLYAAGHQENIFYSYPLMYAYWAQLQNIESLFLPHSDRPFDPKCDANKLDEIARVIMVRSSARDYVSRFPLPTKRVSIPPTISFAKET